MTDAVAALGRTEDVAFSPTNRRLALAAFATNRLSIFDVDITSSDAGTHLALTGGVELSSPVLRYPHGLDFIDDDTLIVTSRGSGVAVFKLPPGATEIRCHEARPLMTWPADGTTTLFNVPGSVWAERLEDGVCELLICNNGTHNISRHLLNLGAGSALRTSEVLVEKYLDIPDGVAVSSDRRWIAVSNHSTHNVLLYANSSALNAESEPDGILRCVYYPHGLCFDAKGRYLFVADAGAPYLHIYAQGPDEWCGARNPIGSVRIMSDAMFSRGRHNAAEGGAKGLDIDTTSNVVVVTSEHQPLAFFDVASLLQHAFAESSVVEQRMLANHYELTLLHERHRLTRKVHEANAFRYSALWRMTAPLRRVNSVFRQHRPPR